MIKQVKLTLLISILLTIGSFLPIFQLTILMVNGGILGLIQNDGFDVSIFGNGIFSIIMIVCFLYTKEKKAQWITMIGVLLFLFPLLCYSTTSFLNNQIHPNIRFLIVGIITSSILFALEWIKIRKSVPENG